MQLADPAACSDWDQHSQQEWYAYLRVQTALCTDDDATYCRLWKLLCLGRATLHKIRQNLAWALMYNVVGIPLAAGALLPSMGIALNASAAGGLMAVSSLAVVSNSLLLRTYNLEAGAEKAVGALQQRQQQHSADRQRTPQMHSSSSAVQ